MAISKLIENPNLCYQCGKCSTGCPVSDHMDIMPHQVVHLLALGMKDRVLESNTVWICAGCYTCAVRCPNDIDITRIMDETRREAIERGVPCPLPDVLTFHKNFINDVGRRGRIHELRMMAEYNLRTGKPFHNATLGPKMLAKGRLQIIPPRPIKGFKRWMKRLWKK
ncbi:MAG: 4Fe-4S dicluster domain-containing protein [Candidatus Hydrogenedentes bacterium]|nr:4Fe-4S dicluster domain-containing protein [Candidatus Hydrogenedentota bacterium]